MVRSLPPLIAILVAGLAAASTPGATTDGDWTMPSRDYAATRYSPLAEITAQNARSLHPVWTFSTGVLGGHEGQPLVVGNTMYVVTPWPNVLYAFDLAREGTRSSGSTVPTSAATQSVSPAATRSTAARSTSTAS